MKERPWPVAAALAGLVVAAVGAAWFGSPPASLRGPQASAAFEAAWEHNLRSTYVVDGTFTRTTTDGNTFQSPIRIARRAPDYLRTGLGASEGVLDGHRVRCLAAVQGSDAGCYTAPEPVDFEAGVQREMANLRTYVEGPRPLYRVVGFRGGCFSLDLNVAYPSPPFGQAALFCFDAGTGAMTGVVERRDDTTDRIQPASVRAAVTDADLQVPSDKGTVLGYGPDTAPGDTVPAPPASGAPTASGPPAS